jgi:hypothetical protein
MSQYVTPPTIPGPVNSSAGAPNTTLWLALSIVITIFCCPLGGIVGIVYSAMAMGSVNAGDIAKAHSQVKSARTWVFISIGVSLLSGIGYYVLISQGLAAGAGGAGGGATP